MRGEEGEEKEGGERIEKKEGKRQGNGGRKVVGGIEWREQEDEGANQACAPNVFLPRAAGSLIGEGTTNFITDWDKISATVSCVCVCVLYSFTSHFSFLLLHLPSSLSSPITLSRLLVLLLWRLVSTRPGWALG